MTSWETGKLPGATLLKGDQSLRSPQSHVTKGFRLALGLVPWRGPTAGFTGGGAVQRARAGFSRSLIGVCCRDTDHQFSRAFGHGVLLILNYPTAQFSRVFGQGLKINPELPYCPEDSGERNCAP
ncbi:hypothetical protein CEXT_292381 [Caerostris extrusa]|uniref:Uncharacterized protein n=1 Tax=Caerostris extrusa TaxID=172846 RepID=A0AAV4MZK9_CAEEX|nr:hypothetical protein CEXT_292381 [Caerostris extrusa]